MTSSQQGATTLQCLDDFYVVDSDESFLSPLSVVACWCLEQYRRTPFPLLSLSECCVASNRHYDIGSLVTMLGTALQYVRKLFGFFCFCFLEH